MDIRVQSVKFDADVKLLEFVDKKVGKLEKFYDEIIRAEVTLTLLPDTANKDVKLRLCMPGKDLFIDKNASTFEDAIVDCVDVLKEQLVKIKEKRAGK
ncbi:MAG: HPF/RaiA family ribosome-associated protein [Bacteroidales bacterium]